MKRQLILTLFLLFFTLSLGVLCENGSRRIANRFQSDMLSVARSLADENTDAALKSAENIYADWQEKSRLVQLWVNHADIDHVTESLLDLRAALIAKDFSSALSAYARCVENFGHLHHRDAFTLRNLL
ncbi:MAG: DUF4363 family protein [Clostridia bacterium]|nr:DUF4363 family protein [Clostridia bacterium]